MRKSFAQYYMVRGAKIGIKCGFLSSMAAHTTGNFCRRRKLMPGMRLMDFFDSQDSLLTLVPKFLR